MTKYPPYFLCLKDDDSVVNTVTNIDAGFPNIMVRFPTEKNVCYSQHSAFYTSTGSLFQVAKQPTHEADHSPISCTKFMN